MVNRKLQHTIAHRGLSLEYDTGDTGAQMQQEKKIFAVELKYDDDRLNLRELFPGIVNVDGTVFMVRYGKDEDCQSWFLVSWITHGVVHTWTLKVPVLTICVAREIAV